jgi:hypothetical protein
VLRPTRAYVDLSLPYQRKVNVSQRVYKMRSFQENVLIFNDNKANLLIQISELNQLREQLRKALQSAQSGGRECELNIQRVPEGR